MDTPADPLAWLERFPLAVTDGERLTSDEPSEALLALLLSRWARAAGARGVLHVARSETRAARLARAARSFAPDLEVLLLPPWDCSAYDRASPSRATMGLRCSALTRLARHPRAPARLVIATVESLLQRLPPRSAWANACLELTPDQPLDELRVWLIASGYLLDERVDEPGEAALRGEVIEIFPSDDEQPVRIEHAGGKIGRMRRYDPVDQRTTEDVHALALHPASEVLLAPEAVHAFLAGEDQAAASEVLVGPPERPHRVGGLEHRLPLFYDRLETLFDYLAEAVLTFDPEVEERREAWLAQTADAFATCAAARRNGRTAPLEPHQLYLDEAEWQERLAGRRIVVFERHDDGASVFDLDRSAAAGSALARFVQARAEAGKRVVVAVPEPSARARLARVLERRTGMTIGTLERWSDVAALPPGAIALADLDVQSGFELEGLTLVAAPQAGRPPGRAAADASSSEALPGTGDELRPGDLVVHAEHGIGRLRGLELQQADPQAPADEYLSVEFAGERKLLVPVLEADQIWRYGSEAAAVPLDRLGGEDWRTRRAEIETQLEATAGELLVLARQRRAARGPQLRPPPAAYRRFAARFPFGPTADQARAIEAALGDLARGSPPLDRLVCGDVGFGKTEVALRAACAAVLAGRQVAVVAPTTVLVRQHLETFRRRFAGFSVRIEQLSRLSGGAEARAVRRGLADGTVGVVIGTHALASAQVGFADLGLVVVDEEQRFGARQKEQLRRLRAGAHVLTLTATPIPRTLQAALVGLVDISAIAIPPVRRRPVRTFVMPFDPATVREALRREARRGGQSFFVCPRIRDLEPMAEDLARLVPELDMVVAHGRMKGALLDEIMVRFAAGAHDVLLTTDIVEAGLDIPNANTMLVWRADRFGLAQLHQLRGRVGRGSRQATAYLLTDPEASLAPATEQRLRTLEAMEALGAGFAIGAQDLDLRGAGDLLGEAQAGHVRVIGTELFQRLLGRALSRARGEPVPLECRLKLRIGVTALIPSDYVPEPEIRIALYRRLLRLTDPAEVPEFADELLDRFGPPPAPAQALLGLAELRLRCCALGIVLLEAGPKAVALEFQDEANLGRAAAGLAAEGAQLRLRDRRLIVSRGAERRQPELLPELGRLLECVGESVSARMSDQDG